MPKLSETTIDEMRRQGFIGTAEAAAITNLPDSTLRSWARTKRVRSCRVGTSLFLEIDSLKDVAGPVFVENNGAGPAAKKTHGGKTKC
jgi:hypothetical protein